MYLKIVCLNQLNWNYFYLLPLRLLLLPLNKNYFSYIVGFCVYIINGDMEFLFSCSIQYLTLSSSSLVRYRVEHSKRNSNSPHDHVFIVHLKGQNIQLTSEPSAWKMKAHEIKRNKAGGTS